MWKTGRVFALLAMAGALSATAAQAQMHGHGHRGQGVQRAAGGEMFTLGVYGGGYSPLASLAPGYEFGNSGAVGGTATLWLHPHLGVRGNVLFARTDVSRGAPAPLAGERPNVWAYSGDLVLRHPVRSSNGRDIWFPYVVVGVGGKTYDFEGRDTQTDFAANYGAGLEYRFARWGIQAEVRDMISSFERFGVDKRQHDLVWTAGITRSF